MRDREASRVRKRAGARFGRVLLAGLLAFSLSPVSAFAEEAVTEPETEVESVVDPDEAAPAVEQDVSEPASIDCDVPATDEDSIALAPSTEEGEDVDGSAVALSSEALTLEIQPPEKAVTAPDFQIKNVDGGTKAFNADYKGKARMIVIGRSTCPNTTSVSASMAKLLSQQKYENVQGVVLCLESGDVSSFKKKYQGSGTDNLIYGADGDAYKNLGWNLYRQAGYNVSSITLPFVFLVDESNAVQYVSTGYLSERDIADGLSKLSGISPEPQEKTVSFKIAGTDKQSEGRALLSLVNAERQKAGRASLAWSEALEKTAQQRAAELAIYYSHTRPDGSECWTAFPSGTGASGENIAIGQSNAGSVNYSWTNSPGHYANMTNASFASMGSACFAATCSDGTTVNCWVEVFGGAAGSGIITATKDQKVLKDVTSLEKNLALFLDGRASMQVGDTSSFQLSNINQEWSYASQVIESASASWSSSNPSVASVDSTGRVSAKQAGVATVKAALGSKSTSMAVAVSKAPEPVVPDPEPEPDNPKPVEPDDPKPVEPDNPKPVEPSKPDPQPTAPQASRLAGATALDTMAAITKKGFANGSCDTVVVATMGGYWDALTASALAGLKNCPILLTDGTALSTQTAAEVKRLGASKVYLAGGTAAISKDVERSLAKISGVKSVKRLAGSIAVNTALEIYKEGKGSWGKTAVIATSETFQDALSASPYAYAKKAPIFLANASTHTLDPQVLSAVKQGGFNRVVIVGGTAALSSEIEKEQLIGIKCERLAGATAYETSSAIATWCLKQGMKADNLGIATGESYYDALAGASLCGKNNAAIVLVSDGNRSTIDSFIAPRKKSISKTFVFGGPAAVSGSTYNALLSALK